MLAMVSAKPMSKCHAVSTWTALTFEGSGVMYPNGTGAGAAELRSSKAVIVIGVCDDWESGFQWRGGKGGST